MLFGSSFLLQVGAETKYLLSSTLCVNSLRMWGKFEILAISMCFINFSKQYTTMYLKF